MLRTDGTASQATPQPAGPRGSVSPLEPGEIPSTDRVTDQARHGPTSPSVGAERLSEDAAERSREDLLLLRRAAAGDGQAFGELVERHAKSMYRLAYMLLGSNADAEDVLQETWTGVYKALKRFEGRSTVRTWLTRILTTQVALWRRKRRGGVMRIGVISLDDSPGAEDDALPRAEKSAARASDWQADLEVALAKLSDDHREVIVLREIDGFSYDEIADSLKVPRGTVESRLHRARGELRKHLKSYTAD